MNHSRDAKETWKSPGVSPSVALVDRARMGLRVQGRYRIVSEQAEFLRDGSRHQSPARDVA